jgi:hypothetical protein
MGAKFDANITVNQGGFVLAYRELSSTWRRADGNVEPRGWGPSAELMESVIASFRR